MQKLQKSDGPPSLFLSFIIMQTKIAHFHLINGFVVFYGFTCNVHQNKAKAESIYNINLQNGTFILEI